MIAMATSSSINVNAERIAARESAQPHEKRTPMEPSCAGKEMRNIAAEEIRTLLRPAQTHYLRRQHANVRRSLNGTLPRVSHIWGMRARS